MRFTPFILATIATISHALPVSQDVDVRGLKAWKRADAVSSLISTVTELKADRAAWKREAEPTCGGKPCAWKREAEPTCGGKLCAWKREAEPTCGGKLCAWKRFVEIGKSILPSTESKTSKFHPDVAGQKRDAEPTCGGKLCAWKRVVETVTGLLPSSESTSPTFQSDMAAWKRERTVSTEGRGGYDMSKREHTVSTEGRGGYDMSRREPIKKPLPAWKREDTEAPISSEIVDELLSPNSMTAARRAENKAW